MKYDEIKEMEKVEVDLSDIPQDSPEVFADLASRIRGKVGDTPDLKALSGVLYKVSTSCKERTVRTALIKTSEKPSGLYGILTRHKIKSVLPKELKRPDVIDAIVQVGAWAAKDDTIWRLVYPVIDQK